MTLPASGQISLSDINNEFALGANLNAYRGATWFTDSGSSGIFPTNQISFSDFYGTRKTSPMVYKNLSTSLQEVNLRTWAVNNGWNQTTPITVTIDPGVYVWSDNTSIAAMTIDGSWPGGLTVVNNGYIMGRGGDGGSITGISGTDSCNYTPAGSGGPAISTSVNFTLVNNSYIGGGGGGGGYAQDSPVSTFYGSGGSGGGGAGGGKGGFIIRNYGYQAEGGAIGQVGKNGVFVSSYISPTQTAYGAVSWPSGGAGGRIMPGTGGFGAANMGTYQVYLPGDPSRYNGYTWTPVPNLSGPKGGSGGNPGRNGTDSVTNDDGTYPSVMTTNVGPGTGGGAGGGGGYWRRCDVNGPTYTGTTGCNAAGGGGGWGASGGNGLFYKSGYYVVSTAGAGGAAILRNGASVSISGSGTLYGAVV